MATSTSVTSNYKGEFAGKYFASAINEAVTIKNGLISIRPNIKYKSTVKKVALSNGTTDFTCDFTPGGSVTLTEVILEPKKLMVPMQLCKEDFVADWEAASMGLGANNENLPAKFSDFLIGRILATEANTIDSNIWTGSGATDGEFGGILNDVAGSSISVTYSAVTAANIVNTLQAVLDAVPDAVLGAADFKIVVAPNVARAYTRALSTSGYLNQYSVGEKPLDFEGYELNVVPNLPAGTIVAYQVGNIWFGTGLMNDFQSIEILDMHDKDLSDNVRIKMVYTAGVKVVYPGEVVLHKA